MICKDIMEYAIFIWLINALYYYRSVPGVFGHRQNENLPVIKRMLLAGLQSSSEILQTQAVKAVGAFILLHDKEPAIQKHFTDILIPLMQVGSFNSAKVFLFSILLLNLWYCCDVLIYLLVLYLYEMHTFFLNLVIMCVLWNLEIVIELLVHNKLYSGTAHMTPVCTHLDFNLLY